MTLRVNGAAGVFPSLLVLLPVILGFLVLLSNGIPGHRTLTFLTTELTWLLGKKPSTFTRIPRPFPAPGSSMAPARLAVKVCLLSPFLSFLLFVAKTFGLFLR